MKTRLLSFLLVLFTGQVVALRAQTAVTGQQLDIGPGGQIKNSASFSGAIGSGNTVSASWPWGGTYSLAVGLSNSIHADGSQIVGAWNFLAGADYEVEGSEYSLLVGTFNNGAGHSSFAAGQNNYIIGDTGYEHVYATGVIGYGLISKWSKSLIIGQYNDSTVPLQSGLLFAIGNGANASNRSNAFEVYASGKVVMPRQGDILMGEFGNPE